LGLAVLLAVLVPTIGYHVLRHHLSRFDAAALAATYGSVSAVTFITAVQALESRGLPFGGHMAAAMALMESPAIVIAVVLAHHARRRQGGAGTAPPMGKVMHEALTDGAQLLLLGAMVVGLLSGEAGRAAMQPFTGDLFKGMLAFFLLDMGLLTARHGGALKGLSPWLLVYAVAAPLLHALMAFALAYWCALPPGDTALLMVLAASASYIAVPAVVRQAIPEANPSLYFGMSLGLTFPFNILFGIPLYLHIAHAGLAGA
jgi:hypothetical protein